MGTSSGQILSEPELAWRGQTPPFLSELDLGLEPKSAKFCPNRDLASKGITRGPIFLHHYGRSHGRRRGLSASTFGVWFDIFGRLCTDSQHVALLGSWADGSRCCIQLRFLYFTDSIDLTIFY
jgi:hypothetical protein